MIYLFSTVIFANAFLLFWLEPLVAKILLPNYGGSAGVWNTCVAFFQVMLVGGYAYAHLGHRRPRLFCVVHSLLLVTAIVSSFFWFRSSDPYASTSPALSLILSLCLMIGFSFFVIASQGPLIQEWFPLEKGNPYVLFAASNGGSLLGLLSFPFMLETWLPAETQIFLWNIGITILSCAIIAIMVLRKPWQILDSRESDKSETLSWNDRIHWLILSAIPSALMLSVTSYVSNEIAAAPLLWVIPLALYLLTFILVFGEFEIVQVASQQLINFVHRSRNRFLAISMGIFAIAVVLVTYARESAGITIFFHFTLFFLVALNLHSRLKRRRPAPSKLTEYYFWLGLGGAVGGMLVAFVAPLIFIRVHEYPMTLAAAIMFWGQKPWRQLSKKDCIIPLFLGLGALSFVFLFKELGWAQQLDLRLLLLVCALGIFTPGTNRVRISLGIMVLLWVSSFYPTREGWWLVHAKRSFYGIHRVYEDRVHKIFWLQHGDTIHGAQMQFADLPLTYYSPMGPVGDIFRTFRQSHKDARIGIVGLGVGSLLSYANPTDRWKIFEIDPEVIELAKDKRFFRYVSQSKAPLQIGEGDGRLLLKQEPLQSFDLIIIDAFGSDSVPVHLLTKQALEVYLSRLEPNGMLVFHVSSRFFDLSSVLATTGNELGVKTFARQHTPGPDVPAVYKSKWIYMTRDGKYNAGQNWHPVAPKANMRFLWTDMHSSILSVL